MQRRTVKIFGSGVRHIPVNHCGTLLVAILVSLAISGLTLHSHGSEPQSLPTNPTGRGETDQESVGDSHLSTIIDDHIRARWAEKGLQPAAPSADAEFVRRIYLDLYGRIPTGDEVLGFVENRAPDKRVELIDRLLASEEYVIHLANQLSALLLGRTSFPPPTNWITWLRDAVRTGEGWDEIASAMLLARPSTPGDLGASEFLVQRFSGSDSLDVVTRDVTRLVFGVDMQCARCHVHPEVVDWEPANYWGIAAFFTRSYLVDIDGNSYLAERARGETTYADVETKQSHTAMPIFMTGAVAPEQPEPLQEPRERIEERKAKYPDAKDDSPLLDNPDEYVVPPQEDPNAPSQPLFSRRAAFVELAVDQANPYFARSMVNRVWSWLFGRGLVEPLDQLHDENPASHPELMGALTEDFINHGFDFRRLFRAIVSSEVYQLSSVRHASGTSPPSTDYAQAQLRPLSAHQFASALMVATGFFEGVTRSTFETSHAERLGELIKRLDSGSDRFQHGLPLALFFANNSAFAALIREGGLASRVAAMEDDEHLITVVFQSVLTRPPDANELAVMRSFLTARPDRREEACGHMIWSLLTSSEFRFNH